MIVYIENPRKSMTTTGIINEFISLKQHKDGENNRDCTLETSVG